MNQIIEFITSRKAIRKFRPEKLKREELEEIITAALYAPSAGGRQTALFAVCEDEVINDKIGRINRNLFWGDRVKTGGKGVSEVQPSIADTMDIPSAFYKAPCVITVFMPKGFLYAHDDACVAAQNIMLAAHALGIGSCMIGRADKTFEDEYCAGVARSWGIPQGYEAQCHVALGYVEGKYPAKTPRRENRVFWN